MIHSIHQAHDYHCLIGQPSGSQFYFVVEISSLNNQSIVSNESDISENLRHNSVVGRWLRWWTRVSGVSCFFWFLKSLFSLTGSAKYWLQKSSVGFYNSVRWRRCRCAEQSWSSCESPRWVYVDCCVVMLWLISFHLSVSSVRVQPFLLKSYGRD